MDAEVDQRHQHRRRINRRTRMLTRRERERTENASFTSDDAVPSIACRTRIKSMRGKANKEEKTCDLSLFTFFSLFLRDHTCELSRVERLTA